MVLEKLISLRTARRSPLAMFIVGDVVSIVCLLISFIVFPDSVGLFTTVLITFAMLPFMVDLIRYEEAETEEEIQSRKRMNLLQRHSDILSIYAAFFAGMIVALTVVFIMLPEPIVEKIFQDQINEINIIRGRLVFLGTFERIVVNNISVLAISFLFSFLFGAGAIFILAWNASVLAAAIGLAARAFGGIKGLPAAVLVFLPHGSLEILAYFIGAIAGGLVSAAVTRKRSKQFWGIVKDSFTLMAVSIILLLMAGGIETMAIHL